MKRFSFSARLCSGFLGAAFASSQAHAMTSLERHVQQLAAPHLTAPAGQNKVVAHYATVNGFLVGRPNNAERLAKFKVDVNFCVNGFRHTNKPIQLPTEWPEYLNGSRTDTYITDQFAISYAHHWVYGTYTDVCSLAETYSYTATLSSAAGICSIDLLAKTAKGQCNIERHHATSARPPASPLPTGPTQTVAGLRCGVSSLLGVELCVALDGIMRPARPLVLSEWSESGFQKKASAADLDMVVNESVFAPHLMPGFSVKVVAPRERGLFQR